MTLDAPKIETGLYWVDAACPKCGVVSEVAVTIRAVVTFPEDERATLGLKCKSSKIDHSCGQTSLRLAGQEQLS